MARINIDSKFFSDGRINLAAQKLKINKWELRGRLLDLWNYCYINATPFIEKDLIDPLCEFPGICQALFESKLLEEAGNKFKIKGIDERIGYLKKDFSAMGKKSAEARLAKYGKSQPLTEHDTNCQFGPSSNMTEPSSSSSSSSSLIFSNNKYLVSSGGSESSTPLISKQENVHLFIKEYCEIYKQHYNANPPITGKASGIAKRLVKDLGLEKAKNLIKAYLSIRSDPLFMAKKHPLEIFEQNLNSILIFAETGKYVTIEEMKQRERNILAKKPVSVNNF